jgi:prophage antirepressor-like protein
MPKVAKNIENVAKKEELEWTYAQFHFRHGDPLAFIEAVRIDGEPWYLVHDVANYLSKTISDTMSFDVIKAVETMRMITHENTGETRRFISHDEFARIILRLSVSFVA